MSMSDYLENKDLDTWYGKQFSAVPATIYFQLHSADPTDTGTVAQIAIPRASLTNNSTSFPAASGGSKTNGVKISWGTTQGQTWATATHVSLWDAPTGGNCLDYGALSASANVSDRVEVFMNAGSLTLTRA